MKNDIREEIELKIYVKRWVCEVGPPMPQNHSSVKSSESFETKGRVLVTFQKEFRPLRQGTHNSKMGGPTSRFLTYQD